MARRNVRRIELVSSFDITTPDVYELELSCGHSVEASQAAVESAPRAEGGRLLAWDCPTCIEAEREEIVADLPGAD